MLRSFTEGILRAHKEKPERDTLCISEDFSAVRAQKRPVKPYIFLSQAALRGRFFLSALRRLPRSRGNGGLFQPFFRFYCACFIAFFRIFYYNEG